MGSIISSPHEAVAANTTETEFVRGGGVCPSTLKPVFDFLTKNSRFNRSRPSATVQSCPESCRPGTQQSRHTEEGVSADVV